MTTAAEQAIIEQTTKAIAAGEDPFGDNDGFETTTTTTTDNDPAAADAATDAVAERTAAEAAAETAKPNDGDPASEGANTQKSADTSVDVAALEAIANGEDAAALPVVADPLNFNVNAPTDYKTARTTLLTEKAEAMAKLMGGEIDAAEYAQIETRVMDSLEDLSAQRIRAETLQEVNTQSAAQSQSAVIQALIKSTAEVVPYATDAKAQRQFDIALNGLSADPEMTGKSFAELAKEAHKVVLALRGISEKPPAKTAEELAAVAAARIPDGKPPVTLRSIPPAATANTGGNITDALSRLSGQEYEAAYNKLTPSQKAALLDE